MSLALTSLRRPRQSTDERWKALFVAVEREWELLENEIKKEETVSPGWDSDQMKDWASGRIEPLPSSVYTDSPPRKPTPAKSDYFSDFSEVCSESNDEARRSSPSEEEEHNVTEPPFLTANWDTDDFPTAIENNAYVTEWIHTMGCYTAQEWMRWSMDKPFFHRPPWVIPSCIYNYVQPPLFTYPALQGKNGLYYRQQVFTNTDNNHGNAFNAPLRHDLVHHHKTSVPLIPKKEPIDINMGYMIETIFEPEVAYITVQLRDPTHGRLLKLDLWVTDSEINTRLAVNHRRMNHVDSDEAFLPGDVRKGYWDME